MSSKSYNYKYCSKYRYVKGTLNKIYLKNKIATPINMIDSGINECGPFIQELLSISTAPVLSMPPPCSSASEAEQLNQIKHDTSISTVQFIHSIKTWVIENKINFVQLNSLLKILNNFYPELKLPNDGRTLLGAVRTCNINPMKSCKGSDGEYIYFGIVPTLNQYMKNVILRNQIVEAGVIYLSFNVDGIPIFKSSNKQLWPILGHIHLHDVVINPFIIAMFFGDSKPFAIELYLDQFIHEMNDLITNGYIISTNIKIKVCLKAITCDAPARAFLKCVKGHNSKHGSERCTEIGRSVNGRVVYLNIHNCLPRTHELFKKKGYQEHQTSVSPFTKLITVDLINSFALDYMHLCCLGVMRKLLIYWVKGSSESHPVRLSMHLRLKLNSRLLNFSKYTPVEFNRKPRSLLELDRFKATEFRLFLLYTGPVVLKDILPECLYRHFLLYHCSLRILLTPKAVEIARAMLTDFVNECQKLYGPEFCSYNVHSLKHIPDDVIYFKENLHEFSCFTFENFLGKIKATLRTKTRPCAQICKRMAEGLFGVDFKNIESHSNLIYCSTKKISFSNLR